MAERQATRTNLDDRVREVLERSGVADALDVALRQAGAAAVPLQREACLHFLEHVLLDVLVGQVHPATARSIVDELVEHVSPDGTSGTRNKAPDLAPEHHAATLPPPAMGSETNPYDDLASGAVHTRPTPAWGLRRTSELTDSDGSVVWIVISLEAELRERVKSRAPVGTEFVAVDTLGELKAALDRGAHPASCIVIDAQRPSLPLDQAIAALIEDALNQRILLWRMEPAAYDLLVDAVPVARTWLSCEAEVTAVEITQLIGA